MFKSGLLYPELRRMEKEEMRARTGFWEAILKSGTEDNMASQKPRGGYVFKRDWPIVSDAFKKSNAVPLEK